MAEKVARLSDEQWNTIKAALDGEIASLRIQNLRLEAEAASLRAALAAELDERGHIEGCSARNEPGNWIACVSSRCQRIRNALSSDAGKDWLVLSPEAQMKLHEALDDVPIASMSLLYQWYNVTRHAALDTLKVE